MISHALQETFYYDFSSQEVAALIQKIRKKNLPTQSEVIAEILKTIQVSMTADQNVVKNPEFNSIQTASETLRKKKGVCGDFSSVFIALARGLGVPARMIYGMMLQENSLDLIGHAWVEVSIESRPWLPIEPQMPAFIPLSRGYFPLAVFHHLERPKGENLILKNNLAFIALVNSLTLHFSK